jgi:hypothetical protein
LFNILESGASLITIIGCTAKYCCRGPPLQQHIYVYPNAHISVASDDTNG